MPTISLVQVNIERSKHHDTVIPFLREQKADVVTIQELMERDIPLFEQMLGMKCFFTPLCKFARPGEPEGHEGQGIFAANAISTSKIYYAGEYDPLTHFTENKLASIVRIAKALSSAQVEKDGEQFCVATTHFTWSEGGETTDLQRTDVIALFKVLAQLPEFVLAGDFNAPRGREIWETIASKYKDNIPLTYTSSIDPLLHRASPLPYVVDGVFTTPKYAASSVKLHTGISDHCAVTATIAKIA